MNGDSPKGTTKMGDDIQNIKSTVEDMAIERAEHQLADPAAANMQFLQSTLNSADFDGVSAGTSFFNASGKQSVPSSSSSSHSFSGLSPAYSGAGLLSAVAAADMGSASSAMGMAAQVASAAPVTFGKNSVGESANLAALGNKALASPIDMSKLADQSPLLKPIANADGALVPMSAEFMQLMAMIEGSGNGLNPNDALMSLINGLGKNPSAENLQAAIDGVLGQINLLNETFEPVFDGLAGDVQSQLSLQNALPSTDLGVSIFDDAGGLSNTLNDLLGTVDVGSNPQLNSLLNLDNTFDDIASLVGSLPDLDLTPVTDPVIDIVGGVVGGITDGIGGITDPVTDIIGDVVGGITDGIGGITDPVTDIITDVTDPITDVITDITDPVTDIITDVTDPITDVITDITDPVTDVITDVTDPITDVITDITDPILDPILDPIIGGGGLLSGLITGPSEESGAGLLDSLGSGISSSAGSEGGALDGLLGSLDPNR